MDNSQSSDVFSDTSLSCNSSMEIMDTMSYETLLNKTKALLCDTAQIGKVSFPTHFTAVLDDCRACITQSLDLVANLLSDGNISLGKLSECMQDAVCLLQMLSSLIKSIVESVSMSCCSFKTFPTTTGHIIMLVFTHCKNSESVYGVHLNNVQKQLKDLFRTCHELQLTYLMVLEKHFIFDLTEDEQLSVLTKALSINLKIGEVVQSLDVKTMAEQWKAYMALCEKYSSHLVDKQTYQECTQLLCAMIRNNLKNATEAEQEEKVVVRSLKVTNFTIKIMLKICAIFKHAAVRDYSQIVELLIYIYLHNPAYLEIEGRPAHVTNTMATNVCNPSDLLLGELIMDDKFMNVVLAYPMNELKEEKLLGYLFLIVGIAKSTLQKSAQAPTYPKHKLMHCIFRCVPECHIWLNIGLRLKNELQGSNHSIGLFEYMLIYTIGLAVTMTSEEMYYLEKIMYEAILGTDMVTALFSSNLWSALARISNNRQLLLSQVVSLCQIYQKLETSKTFSYSPQRLHISHTLESLFEAMRHEDRIRVSKQFNPLNQRNGSIWSVLRIQNLPKDLQRNVQDEIMERYRSLLCNHQTEESINELVHVMILLGSCSLSAEDVEDSIVQAWLRACPEKYKALTRTVDSRTLWYFEYIQALVSWTSVVEYAFHDNSANLLKVLHVISNIVKVGNTDLNLLLIDLLCKLATIAVHDENKQSVDSVVKESFQTLMEDETNNNVRNKLFKVVSTCDNKRLDQIISSTISKDSQRMLEHYTKHSNNEYDFTKLKETLLQTVDLKYIHKCLELTHEEPNSQSVDQMHKTGSSNFDFADLDTLFDNVSDSEPATKKMKIDNSEAESILDRLEADASLLCNVKENMFNSEHKKRIKSVCEKLKSLVT